MSEKKETESAFTTFEGSGGSSGAGRGGEDESSAALDESLVWEALRTVIDPEIGLDIVTLGLVYEVRPGEEPGWIRIRHTLTTPGCPMEAHIRMGVRRAAEGVPGVERAVSELVWEPRWHPGMIQDDAW